MKIAIGYWLSAIFMLARADPELRQHHIGRLARALDPAPGSRGGLDADVERVLVERLDDLLLPLPALHADIPTVPAAAERVVAPVAEGGVLHLRRIVEAMDRRELARHLG